MRACSTRTACGQSSRLSSTSWLRRRARPSVSAMRALDRMLGGFGSLRPASGKITGFNGADESRFGALRQKSSIFILANSISRVARRGYRLAGPTIRSSAPGMSLKRVASKRIQTTRFKRLFLVCRCPETDSHFRATCFSADVSAIRRCKHRIQARRWRARCCACPTAAT